MDVYQKLIKDYCHCTERDAVDIVLGIRKLEKNNFGNLTKTQLQDKGMEIWERLKPKDKPKVVVSKKAQKLAARLATHQDDVYDYSID